MKFAELCSEHMKKAISQDIKPVTQMIFGTNRFGVPVTIEVVYG